jgi:uncharacterized protein (DUF302 family)
MSDTGRSVGFQVRLATNYEAALDKVTAALKEEGFGVLTEIDVKATLRQKLDVEFRPFKILGACNPPLAYRALQAAPEVGLLLPCNVTVSEEEDGEVLVSLVDPIILADFVDNEELAAVASEAEARLTRVADALRGA